MRVTSPRRRPSVLSLYTGAGGLDLGLEAAGFDVALCVEMDADCRRTISANRPGWRQSEPGDAHALTPTKALQQAECDVGEVTLLAGGPPCQPFSKSSYWVNGDAGRLRDPRAATLGRYLDFAEAVLPRVLLLENVRGIIYNGKSEGLQLLQRRLDSINRRHDVDYQACVLTLNCADFGVPQARERVFIVADREGGALNKPEATHRAPEDLANGITEPHRTAWDAIGDLDLDTWAVTLNARGKWADLLPSIPEGHNYLWHTRRGGGEPLFGWRTRFWSFLLKLAKDRPAWTIQAAPGPATGPFHWRSRHLSTRELCRIQTFPDAYEVEGDYRSQHRQIGNAVPPAIGELLGREIRRQILGERARRQNSFVPPSRADCPPAEAVRPVPRKHLKHRGRHRDHPGTGKGPGAARRDG